MENLLRPRNRATMHVVLLPNSNDRLDAIPQARDEEEDSIRPSPEAVLEAYARHGWRMVLL